MEFFSNIKLCEAIIEKYDSFSLLQTGFLSQIICDYLTKNPNCEKGLFITFSAKAAYYSERSSSYDIISAVIGSFAEEERWIYWSLFMAVCETESLSIPGEWKAFNDYIIDFYHRIYGISKGNKLALFAMVKEWVVSKEIKAETKDIISSQLNILYDIYENSRSTVFEIALVVPINIHLMNIALSKVLENNSIMTKTDVLALKYISKKPDILNFSSDIPKLFSNFYNNKNNSFHHEAFVSLIKNSISNIVYHGEILSYLKTEIMKHTQISTWRKSASIICHIFEIAKCIDPYIVDEEWINYRDTTLKQWYRQNSESLPTQTPVLVKDDDFEFSSNSDDDTDLEKAAEALFDPFGSFSETTELDGINPIKKNDAGIDFEQIVVDLGDEIENSDEINFEFPPDGAEIPEIETNHPSEVSFMEFNDDKITKESDDLVFDNDGEINEIEPFDVDFAFPVEFNVQPDNNMFNNIDISQSHYESLISDEHMIPDFPPSENTFNFQHKFKSSEEAFTNIIKNPH